MKASHVMFVLLPVLLPVAGQAPTNPTRRPTEVNQQAGGSQNVSPPAHSTSPTPPKENQDEGKTPASQSEPRHVIVDSIPGVEKDPWDKAYICLTGALVFIAALTLLAIWYQAVKTREAAEATRDAAKATLRSTQFQETGLRQWVKLTDWDFVRSEGEETRLVISYKITNPTDIPLDLDMVSTTVDGGQIMNHGAVSWLVPDNPYSMSIPILLTADRNIKFQNSKLVVTLDCSVFYTDALGKQWEQKFVRYFVCGPDGFSVVEARNTVRDSTPTIWRKDT